MAIDSVAPQPETEPVHFVADARLLSVLGEQLIGSEKVGVLELIKNAYDAGASVCTVTIEGVPGMEPATRNLTDYANLVGPVIEIRDDGSGMSRDAIINGWLRPATSSRGRIKERLKQERAAAAQRGTLDSYDALVETLKQEHKGRIPLGEKGVGRLATHRLGTQLWLRTKTQDDPLEWELRIDWSDFDAYQAKPIDLSAVPLTLKHQAPSTDYGDKNQGTVIACYGGREGYGWTEESLIDLARAIGALRSPRTQVGGFSVSFQTPHVEPDRLDNPSDLEAPFELVALVDEFGLADIELSFTPPEHLERAPAGFRRLDHIDLRTKDIDHWRPRNGLEQRGSAAGQPKMRQPECGAFMIHALCWIRLPKWLGPAHREITTYLDRFGGLSIYRDGMLAQPAQQAARSDWLGLAAQQIKKSSRLSYYQLIGEIEIEQTKTLALRDRSSREGLIETQAFNDLTALTKGVLSELEIHTRAVRDDWTRRQRTRELSTPSAAAALRAGAKLFVALAESYDFAKDPLELKDVSPAFRSKRRVLAISEALKDMPDFLSQREDERNGLLDAAGFGLAVAVGIHEIAHVASNIASDSRFLVRNLNSEEAPNRLRHLSRRAESLLTEVRRLTPLRTTRTEPLQAVSLKKAVDVARTAFGSSLDNAKIGMRIEGDDFTIAARFGAISQVFANLLDNAIYWLSTSDNKREVRVIINAADRSVLFADSGRGISDKMQPVLFEPFYSEKAVPSGLGLFICRYYLGQVRATIRLAKPSERCDLPGAQFFLSFAKTPEGTR
jgi:signal transduction histidine kinase